MTRQLKDWIPAYLDFTSGTEAPRIMHFWVGISTLAGVLRRRVWIDMKRFKWYPNFFIILVAPPGVISKTTTMDMGLDLLKRVPGIKFGPDVVTWQALAQRLAESGESFEWPEHSGDWLPMSALTLASGELGNLINPLDREMINFYIAMWDNRLAFEKVTKASGTDQISAPWVNLVGCTTPQWIAENMPAVTIGGGFTSRCLWVYGDKKETFIAYPDEHTKPNHDLYADALVADLEHIATTLLGPFVLAKEAREWGREWYEVLWKGTERGIEDDRLDGYLARKQTHMHKLAMILSASRGDSQVIELEDLVLADKMLVATETHLDKVFSKIGKSDQANNADKFLAYVKFHSPIPYEQAYRHVHQYFPDFKDFEGIVAGAIRSGQIKVEFTGVPRHDPISGKPSMDARLVYVGAQ